MPVAESRKTTIAERPPADVDGANEKIPAHGETEASSVASDSDGVGRRPRREQVVGAQRRERPAAVRQHRQGTAANSSQRAAAATSVAMYSAAADCTPIFTPGRCDSSFASFGKKILLAQIPPTKYREIIVSTVQEGGLNSVNAGWLLAGKCCLAA